MIVRGSFRESWIDASPAKREVIFAASIDIHRGWLAKDCPLIFTMDDTGAVGRVEDLAATSIRSGRSLIPASSENCWSRSGTRRVKPLFASPSTSRCRPSLGSQSWSETLAARRRRPRQARDVTRDRRHAYSWASPARAPES